MGLSHLDAEGQARMVDVGAKVPTERRARAAARLWMAPATVELLQRDAFPKGDVFAVARVAGIMAAKRTAELVPLCHSLALTQVEVSFQVDRNRGRVDVECTARTVERTGVEMEAMVGACMAAITIYDMCKGVDRGMVLGDVRLLEKTGGKEPYLRQEGLVVSVNVSPEKGEKKTPVPHVLLRMEHGIEGDGHAGAWHRQVSLLAEESVNKMRDQGLEVGPGDFAENLTTRGLDLLRLPVGSRLKVGPALLEITQLGKECHERCAIYYQTGDCVMPREGVFARVLEGGEVVPGDLVMVVGYAGGSE